MTTGSDSLEPAVASLSVLALMNFGKNSCPLPPKLCQQTTAPVDKIRTPRQTKAANGGRLRCLGAGATCAGTFVAFAAGQTSSGSIETRRRGSGMLLRSSCISLGRSIGRATPLSVSHFRASIPELRARQSRFADLADDVENELVRLLNPGSRIGFRDKIDIGDSSTRSTIAPK